MATPFRVSKDDPHVQRDDAMEFRLTYEGPLLAETERDATVRRTRADHKHEIRKALHPQLRQWWQVSPYLQQQPPDPPIAGKGVVFAWPSFQHTQRRIAERFERFGYNFVPLALKELDLHCSVEILLLREGMPGGVVTNTGDLDNRLKTLFDALSMPKEANQVGKYKKPDSDEVPFFCLLEDDSVITRASVESDTLLEPVSTPPSHNDVRAVITVKLRPSRVNALNVGFF
jgi:hypothetical protein